MVRIANLLALDTMAYSDGIPCPYVDWSKVILHIWNVAFLESFVNWEFDRDCPTENGMLRRQIEVQPSVSVSAEAAAVATSFG